MTFPVFLLFVKILAGILILFQILFQGTVVRDYRNVSYKSELR